MNDFALIDRLIVLENRLSNINRLRYLAFEERGKMRQWVKLSVATQRKIKILSKLIGLTPKP